MKYLGFKIVAAEIALAAVMFAGINATAHAEADTGLTVIKAQIELAKIAGKLETLTGELPKGQTAIETGVADAQGIQAMLERNVADYINQGLSCEQIRDKETKSSDDLTTKGLEEDNKKTPITLKAKDRFAAAVGELAYSICYDLTN